MSDTPKPTKISREGVILIKSFEGFRPRAVQRADGRWMIGYGHTRSAREGLSVSESDAELLLQYDLIPVVRAIASVQAPLNQHQFDALASFAFSVGVDRFTTSDVLARLNAGASDEAAEALLAWTDDNAVVAPPRRRAAERALFVANPDAPVSLADLLAAPLPPVTATLVERTVEPEPSAEAVAFENTDVAPFPALPSATLTTAAAVAVLLGEHEDQRPVIIEETPPAEGESTPDVLIETDAAKEAEPETESEPRPATSAPQPEATASVAAFYSPYAVRADGPLLGFGTGRLNAKPDAPATAANDVAAQQVEVDTTEDRAVEISFAPTPALPDSSPNDSAGASEDVSPPEPVVEPATSEDAPETVEPSQLIAEQAVEVPVFAAAEQPLEPVPLELTADPVSPQEPSNARVAWPENTETADPDQAPLFGTEESSATDEEAPVDYAPATPPAQQASWSETATFLVMGGIGMLSFGAAMAAFRQSSRSSDETLLIGWVLAVIALACVGVSGYNLYQRWGRADRA
ncbi:MAG: glycoside hydrolase family protein [Brevundimonas sp.]|uniref:lysozyme n=1 Tax=Brevundimonas sp. TaxID=1871086 RepID=UPI0027253C51|nr:glycoside hydrolase family protein [Brevundimonas sp.]MDO9607542.1 glycoside hydrolase family protein [Brevundimonas sp.]